MRVIILTFLTFISIQTFACKCKETKFQEGYSNSDLVFVGKVIDIKDYIKGCKNDECTDYLVVFEITRTLKGNSDNVTIHTFKDSGGCGYPFRYDEEYLVYADKSDENSFRVGLCSRTSKLETEIARSDIKKIEVK
tara:strand:+ start:789 stop:1196 length:408 start_codon:yes stop_codon:yes gene_type:complete